MTRDMLAALLLSLTLTLVLEAAFFLIAGKRDRRDLLLLLLVNVLTNPVVVAAVWLVALYTRVGAIWAILPLEAFAIATEGHYYKRYGRSFERPYLFSVAANLFSYGMGVFIQQFF